MIFTCKFCNTEKYSKNSIIGHETYCKDNPNRKIYTGGQRKGSIPWNKGLTKDTDTRLLKSSMKLSENMKGENNHFFGKKHKPQTRNHRKNESKS
jgi:hypothetical protein